MNATEINPGVEGPGIVGALVSLAVPVDDLVEWGENPRHGDDQSVRVSLATFGQVVPIVFKVEDDIRKVFAGNTRLRAARDLGWSHIAAVDGAHLDADQVRAFALADNRTSELGTFDDAVLLEVIQAVQAASAELVAATGYSPDDIEALLAVTDPEPIPSLDDGMDPDMEDMQYTVQCKVPFDVYERWVAASPDEHLAAVSMVGQV